MKQNSHTRTQILRILREKEFLTASEIAKILAITLSGIRQHLHLLEKEGLIEAKSIKGKPGRPQHKYFLTDKSEKLFFKNYDVLTLELLDQLIKDHGKGLLKNFLKNRTKQLVEKHKTYQKNAKSIKDKIESIAEVQDKSGYMAHIEYKNRIPHLKELNCPFIEVAKKYPEFCEAERKAYEKILGSPVTMNGCRAKGANACTFCLSAKTEINP